MAKFTPLALLSLLAAVTVPGTVVAQEESILTEKVLEISVAAAKLSALAYAEAETIAQWAVGVDAETNATQYVHPDYQEIQFYTEEPDQAIVAKLDGRCYLSFRGTNVNFADWSQNINLGDVELFQDNNATMDSCEGRVGFADFLSSAPVVQGRQDLQACFESCADPLDCVVVTGHSQGGATAAQASIVLFSLNPTVVTFGQPPAVDKDCALIPSERFFRFVNSKLEDDEQGDVGFDPVVFAPAFVSKSVHYGQFILLGEDTTAAKFLGVDQNYTFSPSFFDRQNEIAAHTMDGEPYSYQTRVEALLMTGQSLNDTEFFVSDAGFINGVSCDRAYSELCVSERCGLDFMCSAKFAGLCTPETCKKDFDCASGTCIYESCAAGQGQVEVGCPCRFESNCRSGECDQSLVRFDWTCFDTGFNVSRTNDSGASTYSVVNTGAVATTMLGGLLLGLLW